MAASAECFGDPSLACPYIHDNLKLGQNENAKKRFNVDSPSFTPLQASTNGSVTPSSRSATISPKAANAAVFTPKSQRSSEFLNNRQYRLSTHADYLFGWKDDSLQKAMDAHTYVSAPTLKTQTIAQQNKCTVPDMVKEDIDSCKLQLIPYRRANTHSMRIGLPKLPGDNAVI